MIDPVSSASFNPPVALRRPDEPSYVQEGLTARTRMPTPYRIASPGEIEQAVRDRGALESRVGSLLDVRA